MKMDSTQQSLRPESISPKVMVGFESYPMRPQLKMTNRWEAMVPVPPGTTAINYHFKVDYQYNRFGPPGQESMRTPQYKLEVLDK